MCPKQKSPGSLAGHPERGDFHQADFLLGDIFGPKDIGV